MRPDWSSLRPWHTNAALIVLGLGMIAFTKQLVWEYDTVHHYQIGFSGTSTMHLVLYVGAVMIFLMKPANVDRFTFPIILTVAVLCRFVALFPDPALSTDVYRYVWDGIVQHAHISPYRYVPADSALAFLREPAQEIYDNINRRDYAHTIYPPMAQIIFYLVTWISATVTFMKVAMVAFEGLAAWALIKLLGEMGRPREWILLFAWFPMLIWEFAGSGHVDAIILAFLSLALLFRSRQQPVLVGLFLGAAVLTKFYPLVLVPAFYQRGDWKMPATMAGLAAACYGVYLSAGKLVFGFLGGYAKEEGMETGTRYFLLDFAGRLPGLHWLTNGIYVVFAGLVLVGLSVWAWRVATPVDAPRTAFLKAALGLAMALMLLFSPHYPWYVAWLLPFFVLMPSLTVFAYVGGLFYLCTTALAMGYGPKQFELNEILYGAVVVAFVVEMMLRRMSRHRNLVWGAAA